MLNISWDRYHVPDSHPSRLNSYIRTNNVLKKANFLVHPSYKGVIRDFQLVRILQEAEQKD